MESTAKQPRIHDLPQELRTQIVQELGINHIDSPTLLYYNHAITRDLYNLCLVKLFHHAATERLYETCLRFDLRQLLSTLIQYPALASRVHAIKIEPSVHSARMHSSRKEFRAAKAEQVELFADTVKSYGLSRDDEFHWIRAIKSKKTETLSEALCALLLLQLPKIKVLVLEKGSRIWFPGSSDASCVHGAALRLHHWEFAFPLRSIQPLRYCPDFQTLYYVHLYTETLEGRQTSRLFQIKTLKQLRLKFGRLNDRCCKEHDDFALLESSSNITQLEIESLSQNSAAIGRMIRSCKALEDFSLKLGDGQDLAEDTPPVPLDELLQYLSSAKTTLHHLKLRYEGSLFDIEPLCHFLDFEKLETVEFDSGMLYAKANSFSKLHLLLPQSIRKITINTLSEDLCGLPLLWPDGPLSTLLDDPSVLPHLRYISINRAFIQRNFLDLRRNIDNSIFAELARKYDGMEWILKGRREVVLGLKYT